MNNNLSEEEKQRQKEDLQRKKEEARSVEEFSDGLKSGIGIFKTTMKAFTALSVAIVKATEAFKNLSNASNNNKALKDLNKGGLEFKKSLNDFKTFLYSGALKFENLILGKKGTDKGKNYDEILSSGMSNMQRFDYRQLDKTTMNKNDAASFIMSSYNKAKTAGFDELDANALTDSIIGKASTYSSKNNVSDFSGLVNAFNDLVQNKNYNALSEYGSSFDEMYFKGWMTDNGYNANGVYTDSKMSELILKAITDHMKSTNAEIQAEKKLGFEVANATSAIQSWEGVEAISSVDSSKGVIDYSMLSPALKKEVKPEIYEKMQLKEELNNISETFKKANRELDSILRTSSTKIKNYIRHSDEYVKDKKGNTVGWNSLNNSTNNKTSNISKEQNDIKNYIGSMQTQLVPKSKLDNYGIRQSAIDKESVDVNINLNTELFNAEVKKQTSSAIYKSSNNNFNFYNNSGKKARG